MKDATGELSMTAVAVVAIAVLAGVFRVLIWPQLNSQIKTQTYCSQAFSCDGSLGTSDGGMVQMCYCKSDDCEDTGKVKCPQTQSAQNGSPATPNP